MNEPLNKIPDKNKNIIAFWGCPKKEIINNMHSQYPYAEFLDLDIDYGYDVENGENTEIIESIAPDNYCVIIKNIINNALFLKDKIIKIIAPIGKDKCDSAFIIAQILKDKGLEFFETQNEDTCPDSRYLNLPISDSTLSLRQKVEFITKNIVEQKDYSYLEKCKNPLLGFWGVPPNDLSILDMFPKNTAVYGWLRAVEAEYPGDFNIESYVDKQVPTIFFAQSFCSKTVLAKYLADKHSGLFIDIDKTPTNSIRAKIEAFIKLR